MQSPHLGAVDRTAVVFGFWIRTIIFDVNVSPNDLLNVVLQYSYMMSLEWDQSRKHHHLLLSDDGKILTKTNCNWYRSICSESVLSADTVSSAQWELTLRRKGQFRTNGMEFMMGFVTTSNMENYGAAMIGLNQYETALRIWDKHHPLIHTKGASTAIHEEWMFDLKVGDKFRMNFDFNKKECAAFYNDQLLGIITRDLPETIHLAVSLCYKGSSVETTFFEAK